MAETKSKEQQEKSSTHSMNIAMTYWVDMDISRSLTLHLLLMAFGNIKVHLLISFCVHDLETFGINRLKSY